MFFLKRALLYVRRKKSKVITIGVILFIVSTLVLTGLVIKTASSNTFEIAREKLGASVSYTSDLSSLMESARESGSFTPGSGAGFTIPDDYSKITTKEIEIISNSSYVKDYVINATLAGNAVDFSYYNPSSSTDTTSTFPTNDRGGVSANINVIGVSSSSTDTIFNTDANTLVSGRYFTDLEVTNASKVIIIEQTIATLNNLEVGDSITISKVERRMPGEETTSEDIEITYEIVGIYKTSNATDITSFDFRGSYNLVENTMYLPYTTILSSSLEGLSEEELIAAKEEIELNGYEVESVTFNLNNPSDIDLFISEVSDMDDIDMTYRSLNANDQAYEKMVGSIENVANTSTILVVVVVVAGALIIGLISMLSIKDRKYELGVLLSLGESKKKIILQLITEMLIVAVVSFTLATITSNFTAQLTTNFLLNQEISSVETNTDKRGPGNFGGFGRVNNLASLNVETIEELTVSVNDKDIISMFAIGTLIIILGNITQAMFVLKANPKEILLER